MPVVEHMASADSFFSTFGQGSIPKNVLDMATLQLLRPKHSCKNVGDSDIRRDQI